MRKISIFFLITFSFYSFSSVAYELGRAADPIIKNSKFSSEPIAVFAPEVFVVAVPTEPTNIPKIGEGFDLIKGVRRAANCIMHGGIVENSINFSQSSLSQITDDEMLWRKLNTSIETKANYGGWSGGGTFSESIETRISTSHVNLVARASYITKSVNLLPSNNAILVAGLPDVRIDLTKRAYNLLEAGKLSNFRNTCGDGYIAQIAYGANLISSLDFNTKDYQSKEEIIKAINLSAPGDIFNGSGKTQIQQEITKKSSQLKIDSWQYGGNIQSNPTSQQELLEAYKELPKIAKESPSILYLTVVRYDSLPSVKSTQLKVRPYWIYADQALRQLLRLQTVKNDLARAIAEIESNLGSDPADKNREFIFLKEIDKGTRSITGFKDTLKKLQDKVSVLGTWLAKCMSESNEKNCTPDHNDSLANYNDLIWRARVPLAKSNIPLNLLEDISARVNSNDPISKVEGACYYALTIRANGIRRISAMRQKYDNFVNESETRLAEKEVLNSLSLSTENCKLIIQE